MVKKVLLLPFLTMSSGHHRVADNIQRQIAMQYPHIECKKLDIFHYAYGSIENLITNVYLQWIRRSPESYHFIYTTLAGSKSHSEKKHYRMYAYMFGAAMRRLLQKEKPDLIFCTHSLPSYILSMLKQRRVTDVPVVNVYTDFFINNLWGIGGIDQHWVADAMMKEHLIEAGVPSSRIFVTGIPIYCGTGSALKRTNHPPFTVLLSGGNLGVGGLDTLVEKLGSSSLFRYFVLCGKNKRLYDALSGQANKRPIKPFPYIDSPEQMDRIYNEADAVICKPGGVTISECLHKGKPVFVFSALPGQEAYNLQLLKKRRLVWDLSELAKSSDSLSIEQAIADILMSESEMNRWSREIEKLRQTMHPWRELLQQTIPGNTAHRDRVDFYGHL